MESFSNPSCLCKHVIKNHGFAQSFLKCLAHFSLFQGPPFFFPRFVFFKGCPFQLCPLPRVVQRKTVPGPVFMTSKLVLSCGNGGFPFSASPCSILTLAPVICQRPCTMRPSCHGPRRRCGRGWVNSRTFFWIFCVAV